jgi:tetratricopeptide (TPR) repeat protein
VDPLSEATNANVAWAYIYNRQYDQAIEQCRRTLTFFPNSGLTHMMLGQAYLLEGMYEEAIRVLETEAAASTGWAHRRGLLGYAYALSGNRDKALKILQELRQDGSICSTAMIYTSLGEKHEALTLLERAYDERDPFLSIHHTKSHI